jgi:hypothetical protein
MASGGKSSSSHLSSIIQGAVGKQSASPSAANGLARPTTSPAQVAPNGQPINSQVPNNGFHGLVPMAQNYYTNHQARANDALAGTHIQALQDPNTTPEQRQYHINNLQQIYQSRPDVLQQMGIPVPGAQHIPSIQAIPNASATPAKPQAIPNAPANGNATIVPMSAGGGS